MKFTPEDIDRLAALARLDISPDERAKFAEQLSSIVGYVEALSKAPVDGVEPLEHIVSLANVWREDEAHACDATVRETAVRGFPEREGDLLKVKAVFK